MERLCTELEPLMVLDPLVLTAFVYVCPKAELPAVFEKISPYFATAWLMKRVKDDKYFLRNDVSTCKATVVVNNSLFLILGRRSY
jgi:hypothetical protein